MEFNKTVESNKKNYGRKKKSKKEGKKKFLGGNLFLKKS
jgi:ribosomal protein S8E